MKNKKIAIIGCNGIPANYGGLETLTENIVLGLSDKIKITVYCSKYKRQQFPKEYAGATLKYSKFRANGWQSLLFDITTTVRSLFTNDVVIMMGPGVGMVLILNLLFRKRVIVNHGGLEEWHREKYSWLEGKFLYYSSLFSAKLSNINIADNLILANKLKLEFGVESSVIRYGGDRIPTANSNEEYKKKYESFIGEKYFIAVARAQIDNNIHIILEAFSNNCSETIVVISNFDISTYGKSLYKKYFNQFPNIILINAIYDLCELNYLRSNAFSYIHSHSRCGTAPSLVEAMCLNLYPICFDVPTNRETTWNFAKYFKTSDELNLIVKNLSESDKLSYFKNSQDLIQSEYTWNNICNQYLKVIHG